MPQEGHVISPLPWLADLPPPPESFRVTRPGPEVLAVYARSGIFPAAACATLATAMVVPFMLAVAAAWVAVVVWIVAAAALTRWLSAGITYTLTPAALTIRRGRAIPMVVPWDVVVVVEVRRDPFRMDEPVVHSYGEWVSQGPRAPHVAVEIRRGAIGLDAGTLRLGAGLQDEALPWLHQTLHTAWKSATVGE